LVMPIRRSGSVITLAMVDPSDVFAMDDIKFMTGYDIEPVVTSEGSIKALINKYYDLSSTELETVMKSIEGEESLDIIHEKEEEVKLSELKEAIEEAPVVKLVNLILSITDCP